MQTAATTAVHFFNLLMLCFSIAADYAVHWHSLRLIVISYSGLWCGPDLNILFVNRPYLWSVESLAGAETDEPSISHLPLKRARGGVRFVLFKGSLPSFICMCDDASASTDMNENTSLNSLKHVYVPWLKWFGDFPLCVSKCVFMCRHIYKSPDPQV